MARILVVDGHDPVRWVLANLLKAAGHQVDQAVDGQQALECFAARHFDAVLIDAYLPRLNGLEACRRLRQNSRVPILVISAGGDPAIREWALASGADAFLSKPIQFEGVLAWVRLTIAAKGALCQNALACRRS